MSGHHLEKAVVRLLENDPNRERPFGAGFLATASHVLTCAHVVADVLGIPRDTPERPEATLMLDFPLIDRQPQIKADILKWYPLKENAVVGEIEDIAVLEISPDSALPEEASPIPVEISDAESSFDRSVQIFGFPKAFEQGKYVKGKLQGLTGQGWIEIKHEIMGGLVEGGFSGAPVWDNDAKTVSGMMTCTIACHGEKTAYMIPAATLIQALPEINPDNGIPRPLSDAADLIRPGGAIHVDSRFYIERDADTIVRQEVQRPRGCVCVCGPRQTGKTSLIYRILTSCRQGAMPLRAVFIDFQAIMPQKFESLETVWQTIITAIDLHGIKLQLIK